MYQTAFDLDPGLIDASHGTGTWGHEAEHLPLHEVTFVVVDLETTGGSAEADHITEIGAVKVRGGEVLGEFATLVRPGIEVPAAITALTGISTSMVAGAPVIEAVLPTLLEFLSGAVVVAHNAGFDISFLRQACASGDHAWPDPVVVDTVRLARLLVPLDEVPNHKLGTLAARFGATTTPNHRALDDARATVDVLHALLARAGDVHTLADLRSFGLGAAPAVARRRHLARDVPHGPGVYQFVAADGRVLYVGSAGDLRARVRSYFTRAERRPRMSEMVSLAAAVKHVPCPTLLEARVREVRLIASLRPPYNRRSRRPERTTWLVLTDEAIPRLSLVRSPADRVPLAVFRSRAEAAAALDAANSVIPLRTCTQRLAREGGGVACVLGQIGRCLAPCVTGLTQRYADAVDEVRTALLAGPRPLVQRLRERMAGLTRAHRFEAAAAVRDGMAGLVRGIERAQRLASLRRLTRLVAAVRGEDGGWAITYVVGGRLAGTAVSPAGLHPGLVIETLRATADVDPAQPALLDEADLVWSWLCGAGVRLAEADRADDGWWLPTHGAGGLLSDVSPPPTGRDDPARRHSRSPRGRVRAGRRAQP